MTRSFTPIPKENIITNWHPCSLLDRIRFDMPKSMILISGSAPFVASMGFWGCISRCITFMECMYAKPHIIWRSAVRDCATHRSGEAVHNQSGASPSAYIVPRRFICPESIKLEFFMRTISNQVYVRGVLPQEVAQAVKVPTTFEATELGRVM